MMAPFLIPAEVVSVDRAKFTAKIAIPGLTDGASEYPEAQFCMPLGDVSEHTEIRILPGDRVWITWQAGDPRYPVIVGYRPSNLDNPIQWRRFHHDNIQLDADSQVVVNAANVTVNAQSVTINAPESTFTGAVTVMGLLTYQAGLSGTGTATINQGDVVIDGLRMKGHNHMEQGDGKPTGPARN
ncbi:MAG: hypothetical protein RL748_2256 [Pseudomonadota bacterium]|jgi:hypothetical protein